MISLSLSPRTLASSSPPGPADSRYLLKSYLFINPKEASSFKKFPDCPHGGYIFPPPGALKAGTGVPFNLWGYFVGKACSVAHPARS